MKKNFFKKLSFVLALAMIISVIAPAAGAFAATAPKLSSVKKYLYLNEKDGATEYDFNIANKAKGWKYEWSSSNEDVAVVEDNGLTTAVGTGTAKVSVLITDKNGEEVDELVATVIVKDNIRELTITNTPVDNKLLVGQENDFNRSYVTSSNATTGTTSITRWTVDKADKATINSKGVFKATEAGKYVVTARAFQSTARYDLWKTDNAKYASYVTAEKTYEVTVVASIEKVEQVNANTVKVTFTSPMTDVAANLTLSSLVAATGTKIKQVVKEVKMDDSNKVATVTLYADFSLGGVYVVDFTNMEPVQFTAATQNAADVVDLAITTTQATTGTATDIKVALYNKDGVDITTADLLARVSLANSSEKVYFNEGAKQVTIFNKGDMTTITATFHTYDYDQNTGAEKNTIVRTGVVVGVDPAAAATVSNIASWTLVASAPDFDKVNHTIAAEDPSTNLFVKLAKTDGETFVNNADPAEASNFHFKSSDSNVVIVLDNGTLYPVKTGVAAVVVTYGDKVIGAIELNVVGKRVASVLSLDSYTFALSNSAAVADTKTVKMTVKDQYGADVALADVSVTKNFNAALTSDLTAGAVGDSIVFAGAGAVAGTYTYTVKANGLTKYVVVTVQQPKDGVSVYYKLNVGTSFDTVVKNDDLTEAATIKVIGYASNAVANSVEAITGPGLTVKVFAPNGTDLTSSVDLSGVTSGVLTLVDASAAGSVAKLDKGIYTAKLYKNGVQLLDTVTFEVKDTQSAPVATVDKLVSSATTLQTAVDDCITVKLDGAEVTGFTVGEVIGTGTTVYVKNVVYRQTFTSGAYIDHVVAVNSMINFQ